jgi:hypothetical protein
LHPDYSQQPRIRILTKEEREQIKIGKLDFLSEENKGGRKYCNDVCCYREQWTPLEHGAWGKGTKIPNKCCPSYYRFEDNYVGLKMDAIVNRQIQEIGLNNAIETQNGVRLSKIALVVSIFALVMSIAFGLIGVYNSKRNDVFNQQWRDEQIETIQQIQNNSEELKTINQNIRQNIEVLEEIKKQQQLKKE